MRLTYISSPHLSFGQLLHLFSGRLLSHLVVGHDAVRAQGLELGYQGSGEVSIRTGADEVDSFETERRGNLYHSLT